MLEKESHFQTCLLLIVFFAVLLISSLSGFFYGLSKDYQTYIWSGGIVALISLGVECLIICSLFKGRRKFINEEKGIKNENKGY